MDREERINDFLKKFFEEHYNDNKILFDNLNNIYMLVSYIKNNMEEIEEEIDIRDCSKITFLEAEKLIDGFYKQIEVPFKLNDIVKDGTFDIISTNNHDEATFYELTHGENGYISLHKNIAVYNNGLITDTIVWIHEISHFRNQQDYYRDEVNDILTEIVAFTEEFIYMDYLEKVGYKEDAQLYRAVEYQNLHNILICGERIIKICLLYFRFGEVSKENFKSLYKNYAYYEEYLEYFEEKIINKPHAIFSLIWYCISIISIYNYEKYRENPKYLDNIKELNEKIMEDISLEEALNIMDIKLDRESLIEILKKIDNFRNRIIIESKKRKVH